MSYKYLKGAKEWERKAFYLLVYTTTSRERDLRPPQGRPQGLLAFAFTISVSAVRKTTLFLSEKIKFKFKNIDNGFFKNGFLKSLVYYPNHGRNSGKL